MADFNVQRGQTEIAASATTATITAGTDYTAPTGEAFIRIVANVNAAGGATEARDNLESAWAVIQNPANLGTSITFERTTATTNPVEVWWEIVEYVGAAGGTNEFKVRLAETVELADTVESVNGSTVSGVVTDADVAIFVTGGRNTQTAETPTNEQQVTTAWDSANQQATFTRMVGDPANQYVVTISYVVVEFTGSNWGVERVEHTYAAAGAIETETLTTDVGSLAKAFHHSQLRTDSGNLDETGQEVWLSATNTVSFQLQSGADVDHIAVVWVIHNTQSGGTTDMNVQRVSGTLADSANEQIGTEPVTAVAALATSSIMGESARSSGSGSATVRAQIMFELTNTTTVSIRNAEGGQTQTYRAEVVEWPEAAAGLDNARLADLAFCRGRMRFGPGRLPVPDGTIG